MYIGIPKERRPFEFRVGLSPAGVEILRRAGHTIYVEHDAGGGAGFRDEDYERAGAKLAYSGEEVLGRSQLVLKLARPLQEELGWLQPGAIVAGFLHLSSTQQARIDELQAKRITAVAYEQIQAADGSLPVLRPFSQIGGAMAAQIAARLLQNNWGGKGILMGGVPGVAPAEVVVLGAGVAGTYATQMFLGMGAHVTVIDHNLGQLQRLWDRFPRAVTLISTRRNIERSIAYADVLLAAVLVPGERTPVLVSREMVRSMRPRSVVMDLSIDEGGCVETSRPTTHEHPVYMEEGVLHYCVPNVPGAVARTATHAFVNAAMPYISAIAAAGVDGLLALADVEPGVSLLAGRPLHLSRLSRAAED